MKKHHVSRNDGVMESCLDLTETMEKEFYCVIDLNGADGKEWCDLLFTERHSILPL